MMLQPNDLNGFQALHVLDINSEKMQSEVERTFVSNPTPTNVRTSLERVLPKLEAVDDWFERLLQTLNKKREENNGFECLTFRVKPGSLWIRQHAEVPGIELEVVGRVSQLLADTHYVTVVQAAFDPARKFAYEFWDYQINRSFRDGIYWAYNLDRLVPGNVDGTLGTPFSEQVLLGHHPAPHLSWLAENDKERPGSSAALIPRTFYTSMVEWKTICTLGLLHDVAEKRRQRDLVTNYLAEAQ